MNTFRTTVSINPSSFKIGLKTPVLTIGSCFAEAIGERLLKIFWNGTAIWCDL
jgi:hypothetical protein